MSREVQANYTPECFADLRRPEDTTTYAALDLIAASTILGQVVPLKFPALRSPNGGGVITGGHAVKSTDTVANANFRLWLFTAQPFSAGSYPVGDNGALSLTYASVASLIGYMDFATWTDEGAAAVCDFALMNRAQMPFNTSRAMRAPIDDTLTVGQRTYDGTQLLYGLLQAKAAYAPGNAEQFRIWLDIQQDQ